MRAVLQRVQRAKVSVDDVVEGEIGAGLLVLLGVSKSDSTAEAEQLLKKIVELRIFDDENGVMNRSLLDAKLGMLVVSQFTLYADTSRGRRPSYINAAGPDKALELYEYFVEKASAIVQPLATGKFRAFMAVELVNDGPVTILLDTDKTL